MIQENCVLLEQIGSPTIAVLLPELLHLLAIGTDANYVYEYALGLIRKIGSPKANAAIPIISKKITDGQTIEPYLATHQVEWHDLDEWQTHDKTGDNSDWACTHN